MFDDELDLQVFHEDAAAQRAARVSDMSNEKLVYYFRLLSDIRVVRNVPWLGVLEAELRARNLPDGQNH